MSILLLRKKPGVFDTLVILNLHFMIGIPTFLHGSQATIAVEDGSAYAVAHLAIARTQNAGTHFRLLHKIKQQLLLLFFFVIATSQAQHACVFAFDDC